MGWRVCAVFFGMCVGKHRKGSNSEKLSLLLSLASEKEEADKSFQNETPPRQGQILKKIEIGIPVRGNLMSSVTGSRRFNF
jgi:hypothetical protein